MPYAKAGIKGLNPFGYHPLPPRLRVSNPVITLDSLKKNLNTLPCSRYNIPENESAVKILRGDEESIQSYEKVINDQVNAQ